MATPTTHYDLLKPAVNDATDQDLWGNELNDDLDTIDSIMFLGNNWIKRVITTSDFGTTSDQNKVILADATALILTYTLPDASDAGDGFAVSVLKSDVSTNGVIVDGAGSDTVLGTATQTLSTQNQSLLLVSDGVSNWNAMGYDNVAVASDTVAGKIQIADQTAMETATSTVLSVTPGRAKYAPSSAKAWVTFSSSGGISGSYNVTSVTKNGTGDFTLVYTAAINTPCPTVNAVVNNRNNGNTVMLAANASTGCRVQSQSYSTGAIDLSEYYVVVYGDL